MEEAKSKFEIQFVTAAKDRVGFLCFSFQLTMKIHLHWMNRVLNRECIDLLVTAGKRKRKQSETDK
jgi:hypothetical protein